MTFWDAGAWEGGVCGAALEEEWGWTSRLRSPRTLFNG